MVPQHGDSLFRRIPPADVARAGTQAGTQRGLGGVKTAAVQERLRMGIAACPVTYDARAFRKVERGAVAGGFPGQKIGAVDAVARFPPAPFPRSALSTVFCCSRGLLKWQDNGGRVD